MEHVQELERKLERVKEKKRRIERVTCCWLVIFTVVSVFIVLGVYHFDRFQMEKVFIPLIHLADLNDSIKYNKEQEVKLRGYTDTTKFSEEIRRLSKIREEEYYNNEDRFVAFLCTCPYLVKLPCLLLAFPLIFLVTVGSGIFIVGTYVNLIKAVCKRWKKLNDREKKLKDLIKKNNKRNGGSNGSSGSSGASREIKNLKFRRLDVKRIG